MSERPMHAIPGAFARLQELYAEGEAAIAERDFETGYAKFTEGLSIDDHFRHRYITMYSQRAQALMGMGRFLEAAADLGKALEMEPEPHKPNILFQRGFCYDKAGDAARAIADYDASTALYTEHPGPFHMRGRLHFNAGRWAEAVQDFTQVLELQSSEEATRLKAEAEHNLSLERVVAAQGAAASLASGGAGDADPVVFPGQPIAKLSDYVGLMKKMQAGDMMGALAAYRIDMMAYGGIAQAWAAKMATDPLLTAKFAKMMAG